MHFRSDSDKWLVINSLRTIAKVYHDDAMDAEARQLEPLVRQFKRQAADALRIADQLEQEG